MMLISLCAEQNLTDAEGNASAYQVYHVSRISDEGRGEKGGCGGEVQTALRALRRA